MGEGGNYCGAKNQTELEKHLFLGSCLSYSQIDELHKYLTVFSYTRKIKCLSYFKN